MALMQRGLAGAAVVAAGLMIVPAADAGWLGFGNSTRQPGAAGVTLVQAGADSTRFDQLENSVRRLTGQVEELQHQLDQLTQALQKMQADNEYRLGELENGNGGGQNATAAPPAAPAPADTATAEPPAAGDQPQLGTPPQPLGTLTLPEPQAGDGGQQPLDLSALARGDGSTAGGGVPMAQAQQVPPPSGDPATDYKVAYGLFVSGRYEVADTAFRQFLEAYPGDQRAADATYWLGQSLFSRGLYREAALEFVNGHKLYPSSARAADTMLLLGKSLAGIPEREAACQTFAAALKQYPNMSNALRQRVVFEQANAGC